MVLASQEDILKYKNRLYDSKAIVGVAHGIEYPKEGEKHPADFSGGKATVQKWLEDLGFEVIVLSPGKKS